MAAKGQPKSGGRRRGTPNRASARREAEVRESGLTPLEYMLAVLRDETAAKEDRQWAATMAAPYVHPRLQPIVSRDDQGKPIDDDTAFDMREISRRLLLVWTQADHPGKAPLALIKNCAISRPPFGCTDGPVAGPDRQF